MSAHGLIRRGPSAFLAGRAINPIMERVDTQRLMLLLMETPGIGPRALGAVLRRNAVARRTPEEFLALPAEVLRVEYGIRRDSAELLRRSRERLLMEAEASARWLARAGVQLVAEMDAAYPDRLRRRMDNPPPVLFAYGSHRVLERPLLAVACSNGAPEEALAAADRAVAAALERGWSVVTGHNRLGYQRPALACKRLGAPVLYVLDRGIAEGFGNDLTRELFPAARIWGPAYDVQVDLTLTPFGLRCHGTHANNQRRDSLVFALADAVLAGHVRPGGKMEAACLAVLASGRPVWTAGPWADGLWEHGAAPLGTSDPWASPPRPERWAAGV